MAVAVVRFVGLRGQVLRAAAQRPMHALGFYVLALVLRTSKANPNVKKYDSGLSWWYEKCRVLCRNQIFSRRYAIHE